MAQNNQPASFEESIPPTPVYSQPLMTHAPLPPTPAGAPPTHSGVVPPPVPSPETRAPSTSTDGLELYSASGVRANSRPEPLGLADPCSGRY
ncbi:hypothetical protein CDL15_Pgr011668 [Punica granatum]|uniref:Uncharacterized protein n=1 Tax=Punica granatum TaxID=22663 RepID=A0A218WWA0_PUNGR|nr:hypothetical protein CDL15_Pgr011668 [Punica granatum]